MPQLTRNARAILDHLKNDDAEIRDLLLKAIDRVKANPEYSRDLIWQALDILSQSALKRTDELAPLLERNAPNYEQRLRDVESKVDALIEGRVLITK